MDNSLFNDPLAMAGLSVMSGKNLGEALSEAAQLKQRSDYQAAQMQHWQMQADMAMKEAANPTPPSAVREYQYFNSLSPKEQQRYLAVKRSQETLNLGGSYGVLDQFGNVTKEIQKTLPPEQLPETKYEQASATEKGRSAGEKGVLLNSTESKMPQLEEAVSKLSELGKTATYTTAGQARDYIARQMGAQVPDSAVARAEYISRVDNEILPLLRDTFGAAFTQKEGDSLKATLGNPDASPQEKDAVLKSFIETKKATVGSMKRELGIPSKGNEILKNAGKPTATGGIKFLGFE